MPDHHTAHLGTGEQPLHLGPPFDRGGDRGRVAVPFQHVGRSRGERLPGIQPAAAWCQHQHLGRGAGGVGERLEQTSGGPVADDHADQVVGADVVAG